MLTFIRLLSIIALLFIQLSTIASNGSPVPGPLLTGFSPALTLSPDVLQAHLTGAKTKAVANGRLRIPLLGSPSTWPAINLTQPIGATWQRLGAKQAVLLEVRGRTLKSLARGSFSLVWNEPASKQKARLTFNLGFDNEPKWNLWGNKPEVNGVAWLPKEQPTATGLPLHSIGWLLRQDTIWAVVDNRPVGAYPQGWRFFGPGSAGEMSIELDGDNGQTMELASVRLLAGPVNPPSLPNQAPVLASAAPATPHGSATKVPIAAAAARPTAIRPKAAAPALPPARPPGLTLVATVSGERLRAMADSMGSDAQARLENDLVVLTAPADGRREIVVPLPLPMRRAFQRRQRQQGLLLEMRARLHFNEPNRFGTYGLKLEAYNSDNNAALTYSKDYKQECGSWSLSASPGQYGPQPATGAAAITAFHTLGFYVHQDSLTVYFDDRPVGQTFLAGKGLETMYSGPGNFFLTLFGVNGQEIETSYVRLSAQNEAAFAAQHATETANDARQDAVAQPAPATYSTSTTANPTRTTSGGVQYSTADMSQFTRKPGTVSGYSTGAGATSGKCGRCNGFGKINTRPNSCSYCNGTGGANAFVPTRTWTERGPTGKEYHYQSTEGKQQFVACTHCAGGPTPIWATCPNCHGSGH